jgi:uncharacterized integral membrane protein (TIGR02327 family)
VVTTYLGIDAIARIFSHFLFILMAFWSLKSVHLESIFKPGMMYTRQIRFVYLFLSILLGYTASTFFQEIILITRNLLQSI